MGGVVRSPVVWQPGAVPMVIDPAVVVLVEIKQIDRDQWHNHPGEAAPLGRHLATIGDEPARDLVSRLAQLPEGDRMRCFLPRYAMRVWDQKGDLTDVALCFRCHWICYRRRGKEASFGFDANAPGSKALLDALRSHDDSYTGQA
jgi:hypothetical protein